MTTENFLSRVGKLNLFSRKLDPPLDVVSKQNMMCMVRVIMISTIEELMQTKSLLTTWFKFNGTHERLIAYYGTPTRDILWWGKKIFIYGEYMQKVSITS